MVLLAVLTAQLAHAQDPGDSVYVVTYIDGMPASMSRVATALRRYRQATGHDGGNLSVEVLQRRARENHFAVSEKWKDQTSLDAHRKTAHAAALRDALQGALLAPPDERLLRALTVGPSSRVSPGNGSVYVLTHADALPPASRGVDVLKPLAEASRGESGNIRFDVLQQPTRPNHFTVIEVWQGAKAYDAHTSASHTREFREKFQAMTGALYDDRLYRLLD
jgi:quinol monooxygenase YgiN